MRKIEESRGNMVFLRAVACGLAAALISTGLLFFSALPASGADHWDESSREVDVFLRETIMEGWRTEDVEKVLSAYADEAVIVDYIAGLTDKKGLEKLLVTDFANLNNQTVRVIVHDGIFEEGGRGKLLITLSLRARLTGGHKVSRSDKYYLDISKESGDWKILRQSYRSDFGVSESFHGM